jgi:hypothetical protein
MKKLATILAAFVLSSTVGFSLVGCGGGNNNANSNVTTSDSEDEEDYDEDDDYDDEDYSATETSTNQNTASKSNNYGEPGSRLVCEGVFQRSGNLWINVQHNCTQNGQKGMQYTLGCDNGIIRSSQVKIESAIVDESGHFIQGNTPDGYMHWFSAPFNLPANQSLESHLFLSYNGNLGVLHRNHKYYLMVFLCEANGAVIDWANAVDFTLY